MKLKDDFAKFHAAFFADGSWGLPRQLTNDMNEEHVVQPEEKMSLEEIVSFCLQGFLGALHQTKFKTSEITMEVGGWAQVSHRFFLGKSSQNSPKLVLIFWSSIPCVFCLYIHC